MITGAACTVSSLSIPVEGRLGCSLWHGAVREIEGSSNSLNELFYCDIIYDIAATHLPGVKRVNAATTERTMTQQSAP